MQLLATTKCRYCSPPLENVLEAASMLRLRLTTIDLELEVIRENLPVMLLIYVNDSLSHAALAVEEANGWLSLANYKGLYGNSRVDVRHWDHLILRGDVGYAITRE